TMTSAAMRRSWRNRRTLSGRLDEGMEHADAELARILAGPAADLHGHEGLVDGHLQLGHVGCADLVRLQRDFSKQLVLRHEIELVDHGVADGRSEERRVGKECR